VLMAVSKQGSTLKGGKEDKTKVTKPRKKKGENRNVVSLPEDCVRKRLEKSGERKKKQDPREGQKTWFLKKKLNWKPLGGRQGGLWERGA